MQEYERGISDTKRARGTPNHADATKPTNKIRGNAGANDVDIIRYQAPRENDNKGEDVDDKRGSGDDSDPVRRYEHLQAYNLKAKQVRISLYFYIKLIR